MHRVGVSGRVDRSGWVGWCIVRAGLHGAEAFAMAACATNSLRCDPRMPGCVETCRLVGVSHLEQLILQELYQHVKAERHKLVVRHHAIAVSVHLLHERVDLLPREPQVGLADALVEFV